MLIIFPFILLLQVISLALGAATISPVIQEPELELGIITRLNESLFGDKKIEIVIEESVTKSGRESESKSIDIDIGSSSADFGIPVPSALLPNYMQSKTGTSNGNSVKEDGVIKESDLPDDILEWEAPLWFQKNAPYYHSGYDEDGRPVWVAEWGKYPIRELTLLEDKEAKMFDKYLKQMAARIIKTIPDQKNSTENEIKVFGIVDLDGVDLLKIAHPKSIAVILKWFASYQPLILNHMDSCVVINVNYVASTVINLLRPILGQVVENIEFYGTNAAKWKPQLIRRLPKKAFPPWYGGAADFKPVNVYG